MKKQLAALLIMAGLLVAPVLAQDVPTLEPTLDIITPTPAIEPPVVVVEPIDTVAIPGWVATVALVLVVGIVSVSIVGILQAAKGLPEWSKGLILAGAGSGLASLDDYAKTTPSPIDDLAVEELRKLVSKLQAELNATTQQVVRNTQAIETTAQAVKAQGAKE
jgi:hypothetical protein